MIAGDTPNTLLEFKIPQHEGSGAHCDPCIELGDGRATRVVGGSLEVKIHHEQATSSGQKGGTVGAEMRKDFYS